MNDFSWVFNSIHVGIVPSAFARITPLEKKQLEKSAAVAKEMRLTEKDRIQYAVRREKQPNQHNRQAREWRRSDCNASTCSKGDT